MIGDLPDETPLGPPLPVATVREAGFGRFVVDVVVPEGHPAHDLLAAGLTHGMSLDGDDLADPATLPRLDVLLPRVKDPADAVEELHACGRVCFELR